MAVEVVGFEMARSPLENGAQGDSSLLHDKENGKLDQEAKVNDSIKFGSHGDEPVKVEGDNDSAANLPRDATEEWPAPKQVHSFYFVKHRTYDDPAIKAKIDQADKEVQRKNQARFQITEELRAKRSDRAELINQLKSLKSEGGQLKAILSEKTKEIKPLQQALGKMRNANGAGWNGGLCSSEEELNELIQSFQYRIQHESIPLSEEKQLLREIKQLEGTREKVIANSAARAKIQDSLVQKEAIQDQVKMMGNDLDGVRKEKQAVTAKITNLERELKAIDDEIKSLQDELAVVTEKRDKAFETIQELRKQRQDGNANFFKCREVIKKAKELAIEKDIKAVEELSHEEVENFLSLWNTSKSFRRDYEKRILPSMDGRQLSRDGRTKNPDEKPVVETEVPASSDLEVVAKGNVKRAKEDSKSLPQQQILPRQKESKKKTADLGSTNENNDIMEREMSNLEKPMKDSTGENEVDEEKIKAVKREEEIAKARQAMERKKKLAEKAAAKAAIRAQKEAEKKLKEREKKAKKKAAGTAPPANSEGSTEVVPEVQETPKVEVNGEAPAKEKVQRDNTVRQRNRSKGPDPVSVPKVILKRKKSANYWLWAVPIASVVLILLVLGYQYLF